MLGVVMCACQLITIILLAGSRITTVFYSDNSRVIFQFKNNDSKGCVVRRFLNSSMGNMRIAAIFQPLIPPPPASIALVFKHIA